MRWQLAYTLLFNPSLLGTRKRSRQMTYKEMEKRILKVATLLPHRQQVLKRSQAAVTVAGHVGLVGPAGRVRSNPGLFMKHQEDDRLAAILLNRELMEDRSDIEDDTLGGQEDEVKKDASLKESKQADIAVNNVHHDDKRDSGEPKELKHIYTELKHRTSQDADKHGKETVTRTERTRDDAIKNDVINDSPNDAEGGGAREPSNIVIYLDGPSPSSTEDDSPINRKDH